LFFHLGEIAKLIHNLNPANQDFKEITDAGWTILMAKREWMSLAQVSV